VKIIGQHLVVERPMRILRQGKVHSLDEATSSAPRFLFSPHFKLMKTSFWAIQNVLLTAGLCLTTIQLRAQTIAYDVPKGTTGNLAVPEFGVGNDFKVLSPIVISQLGVFDSGGNGIQGGMVLTVVWLIVVMVPPTAIAFHAISLPSGRDYLNPNTGRFWTMDGEGYGNNEDPRSLHKYLYTEDNPLNGSDPSGNAVYFVQRPLAMTGGSYVYGSSQDPSIGHGYLLFTPYSDPGTGDPFQSGEPVWDTFSFHPSPWLAAR
jgi:hypothetical protein